MTSGKTKTICIFGHPVTHSMSPTIHNAAFKNIGLDYNYIAFDVDPKNIKEALISLKVLNIKGANITIPHKEKVIKYLDQIDPFAKKLGAVNTVVNVNGKLKGYNTDGEGFIRGLKEDSNVTVKNKNVLVIGTGGASRGIIASLISHNVKTIALTNRTEANAIKLKKEFEKKFSFTNFTIIPFKEKMINKLLPVFDVIVNTTSIGMEGEKVKALPLNLRYSKKSVIVSDIVYKPLATPFLKEAKKYKRKTNDGLSMLIHQGAIGFKLWTKKEADTKIMRSAVLKCLR